MFETTMTQNFEMIHAVNSHEFGTPSDAWLKWLDSLSTTVKQDIGAETLIEEDV